MMKQSAIKGMETMSKAEMKKTEGGSLIGAFLVGVAIGGGINFLAAAAGWACGTLGDGEGLC